MNRFTVLNQTLDIVIFEGRSLEEPHLRTLFLARMRYLGLKVRLFPILKTNRWVGVALNILQRKDLLAVMSWVQRGTPPSGFSSSIVPRKVAQDQGQYLPNSVTSSDGFWEWFDHSLPGKDETSFRGISSEWAAGVSVGEVTLAEMSYDWKRVLKGYFSPKFQRLARELDTVVITGSGYRTPPAPAVYDKLLELYVPADFTQIPSDVQALLIKARKAKAFELLEKKKQDNGGTLWSSDATLLDLYSHTW